MRLIWQLSIYALVGSDVAAAQRAITVEWPVDSGSRVRVLSGALGEGFHAGVLVFASKDSIVFTPRRSPAFSITTGQITKMEMARGTHTSKAKYALVGLVVGVVGGAALGAATYKRTTCPPQRICIAMSDTRGFVATAGGVLGGGAGALIGVLAGALPKDTWVPVSIPTR